MRALVYYLYGPENAGDLAICFGTIGFLRRHGVDVTMVSRFDAKAPDYAASCKFVKARYPEVEIVPGQFALDRSVGSLSLMGQYAAGAIKMLFGIGAAETKSLIEQSDIVFFNGGNLLRCAGITDAIRLEALFYPLHIAHRMGKRLVCLPQSTATISPGWRRFLGRKLALFDKIFIREKVSLDRLRELYPNIPFYKSTDMAFFMDDLEKQRCDRKGSVAMIVRGTGIGDIGELPTERQNELLNAYAKFAQEHPELSYTVVVQTKKDRKLSNRLVGLLPSGSEILEEHDPFNLLGIYKSMDVTLSMRLHAAILSLRAGTPVIGLFDKRWGLKNLGVMSDYGVGYSGCAEGLLSEYDRVISDFKQSALNASVATYERELVQALDLDRLQANERKGL